MRLLSIMVMGISMLMPAVASAARPSNDELKKQVADTERAFAATMKARDHAAFTSFLADAGHAFVLAPGDAILLPNRGPAATCLHSVFCASDETGYSLSFALRPDRESPEDAQARTVRRARRQ